MIAPSLGGGGERCGRGEYTKANGKVWLAALLSSAVGMLSNDCKGDKPTIIARLALSSLLSSLFYTTIYSMVGD